MHFAFSPEQIELRNVVRELLSDSDAFTLSRRAASSEPADRELWKELCGLGAQSVLVPAEAGGLGLDERWLVLLLEEFGYWDVPLPVVESIAVAAPILGDKIAQDALVSTDLGSKMVPFAADVDYILLRDGGIGPVLAHREDVMLHPVQTLDPSRRGAWVTPCLDRCTMVGGDLETATARGEWGTAALLIGLAQRMLDMSVDYVLQREQFGVVIGSFQAVKHHLADVAVAIRFARPTLYRASWALAVGDPDRALDVSAAKILAVQAAELAASKALQCHGAIGYTEESDLQLFMKRAWSISRTWGDQNEHYSRVASSWA